VPRANEQVLRAARPAPGVPLLPDQVELTGQVATLMGAGEERGFVRLTCEDTGQATYASIRIDCDSEAGDEVRLGRDLWDALGARVGQPLHVAPHQMPVSERVTVAHGSSHLHGEELELVRVLQDRQPILWDGKGCKAPETLPALRDRLRIHQVVPSPSVVGPQTIVEVVSDPEMLEAASRKDGVATVPPMAHRGDVAGLGGLRSQAFSLVRRSLLHPELFRSVGIRPVKGVLFHGPTGTGKTLLARVIGAELGARVYMTSATDLVGSFSGETESNLRALFASAVKTAPSLIVIDEIDVLSGDRRRMGGIGDVRVSTQLLTLMDGLTPMDGIVVIGTTNRIEAIDEAYRRPGRFDVEYFVGPPSTAKERIGVLDVHSRSMPLTSAAVQRLHAAAHHELIGATGADLMNVVRNAGMAAVERLEAGRGDRRGGEVSVQIEDVTAAIRRYKSSLLASYPAAVAPGSVDWEALEGLDEVKRKLLEAATLSLDPSTSSREGILITGPTGCGKSALARALAKRVGATLVEIDGSTIFNQWLGESESQLRFAFRRARDMAPSVLVLDHVELLAAAADSVVASNSVDQRVLGTLLAEVDRTLNTAGVVVVAVTDRPRFVDQALTRAGRLGLSVDLTSSQADRSRLVAERLARELGFQSDPTEREARELGQRILRAANDPGSVAAVVHAASRLLDAATYERMRTTP
jgi:transitional endoplasmic reticulum ATPase